MYVCECVCRERDNMIKIQPYVMLLCSILSNNMTLRCTGTVLVTLGFVGKD